MLVVGDTKSPKNFEYPNVRFLSIEEQLTLNFTISKLIPFRNYARKNIGYLYAIQHGAEIIYETDDDNQPNSDKIYHLNERENVASYLPNKRAINVYEYFGQPNVWPRGFPLDDINTKTKSIVVPPKEMFIPVQQGLANIDPDVDAIFRLTRKLNITFSKKPAIAIPKVRNSNLLSHI